MRPDRLIAPDFNGEPVEEPEEVGKVYTYKKIA
jgi:hypothetical protein